MSMSSYTVSCHSGFIVQIAGFNKTKVIDVINKKDLIWYSCWKPLNTNISLFSNQIIIRKLI